MENNFLGYKKNKHQILEHKNMGMALLFTLIFGPLGLMYSSIFIGIVMLFVTIVVAYLTAGIGILILWPILLILTYFLISRHNNKVQSLNQINYMD